MLSRIAESLFWIGRYVERADDTARILDVHTQRLVGDPWIDERRACANLMALMGHVVQGGEADTERVLDTLAFDRSSPCSIVGALSAARENARGAREVLSAEIWESLNVTHNALPQQRTMARRYGPHSLFRFVRERSAMVFGLADATMSRDESWLFLILGRSLERVDMTSRIISTRVLAGAGGRGDEEVLGRGLLVLLERGLLPGPERSARGLRAEGLRSRCTPHVGSHSAGRRRDTPNRIWLAFSCRRDV